MANAGFGNDFGTVYVRCPQVIDALAVMGEHGGQVEDGFELVLAENFFHLLLIADVTQNAGKVLVLIGIRAKVNTYALVAFREKFFLENGTEESGATGNQETRHC